MNLKLLLVLITLSFSSLTFAKPFSCELLSLTESTIELKSTKIAGDYLLYHVLLNGKELKVFSAKETNFIEARFVNNDDQPIIRAASDNFLNFSAEGLEYYYMINCRTINEAAKKILESEGPGIK